ncbi:hypothetical protein NSE01_30160 [Novosphingobium sediminis]|uniref:Uncharacterized protein n=1 Tax=Novosphingobium sediminis TaxID=707214 RepID=A0A512ANB6_9SPHN|nr:hypothetical protein [Novosphingobium sediminis]GEO01184.1 hypothetical protein NSE01_30160 [Novosphingobium sediminis]
MRARSPWYLQADSTEDQHKEAELTRSEAAITPTYGRLRQGFVYKRVPHSTLKSIANSADTEDLYDQSYNDRARVRVAGPFTAESLST